MNFPFVGADITRSTASAAASETVFMIKYALAKNVSQPSRVGHSGNPSLLILMLLACILRRLCQEAGFGRLNGILAAFDVVSRFSVQFRRYSMDRLVHPMMVVSTQERGPVSLRDRDGVAPADWRQKLQARQLISVVYTCCKRTMAIVLLRKS